MFVEDTDQICKLHKIELVEGRVPVLYGLIRYSNEYREARDSQFPKSRFLVLGGCVVGNILFHNIRYCPKCRENHVAWAIDNNSKEGLAPTEKQHEKYIEYLAARSGIPRNIPESVHQYVDSGELVKAIKELKKSNPGCNFASLKGFVEKLRQIKGE